MEDHNDTRGNLGRLDKAQEPYQSDPTKAGMKRVFSNRQSSIHSGHGENYEVEQAEEEVHSGKRHRASDWPLTTTHTESPPIRAPLRNRNRNRNAPNSPSFRRTSSSQARPSKFVEGSMNDRVSNKPPITYIDDEEFLDKFDQEENGYSRGRQMTRPKAFVYDHPNHSIAGSSADRSDVSRHSSIFRFGKSLASSFNPSNWKIFSKLQEEIVEETSQQKILRERKEKAESMYQELKKSGRFLDSSFGPSLFQHQEEKESAHKKHDSGVEFSERRSHSRQRSTSRISAETSKEEKRMGRVFLERPQLPANGGSQSPASTSKDSARNAKFHFKKPSLSNIRKSVSDSVSNTPSAGDQHLARRVPSRKDLHKQQKLVKRVSDLETKLEVARRHLAEAIDDPVPSRPARGGRSRFVPGALASLPSERLLSDYCPPEAEVSHSVSVSQIGKAITIDYQPNDAFMSGAGAIEQHGIKKEPTRSPPPPPDFDKSLPQEPDTTFHDRVMQSVEVEGGEGEVSIERDAASETQPSVIKSIKARKAKAVKQEGGSQMSTDSSELADLEIDSDYEVSESGKDETSPEPSESGQHETSPEPSEPSSSHLKPKKRKSMADPIHKTDKPYKPVVESGSDNSSVKPKQTPKKNAGANDPRKLQKTTATAGPSIPNVKSSYQNQPSGAKRLRQRIPAKELSASSKSSKSKILANGRQSVSPPPSGTFTGLEYMKPLPRSSRAGIKAGEAKMATYSAVHTAGGNDAPPMPKIPKAVRLPSGEFLNIASIKNGSASDGKLQPTGSGAGKLAKSRRSPKKGEEKPTPSKKDDFTWPDDVF